MVQMTNLHERTEPVPETERAECPACKARYGRQAEHGTCPQCGTQMNFSTDYEVATFLRYEAVVEDMASRHARTDMACATCNDSTPLAMEWASDAGKASKFEDVAANATDAVQEVSDSDTEPLWVRNQLADSYTEAYRAALPSPVDCQVCQDADAGAHPCGHDRMGEPCPVREE